jgi:hypothetical protein
MKISNFFLVTSWMFIKSTSGLAAASLKDVRFTTALNEAMGKVDNHLTGSIGMTVPIISNALAINGTRYVDDLAGLMKKFKQRLLVKLRRNIETLSEDTIAHHQSKEPFNEFEKIAFAGKLKMMWDATIKSEVSLL